MRFFNLSIFCMTFANILYLPVACVFIILTVFFVRKHYFSCHLNGFFLSVLEPFANLWKPVDSVSALEAFLHCLDH